MIIDGPITFDLTMGSDRRIPQSEDAQTQVPSVVIPVVLALKPTVIDNGGGNLIFTSTVSDVALSVAPSSAASFSAIHILSPGLWELEMAMSSNFNFAMVAGTPGGCGIELQDAITGGRTAVIFRSAFSGSAVDGARLRLLLVKQISLRMFFTATAVAQNIDFRAMVNCIRIL